MMVTNPHAHENGGAGDGGGSGGGLIGQGGSGGGNGGGGSGGVPALPEPNYLYLDADHDPQFARWYTVELDL